ncbi:MAG: response regulator transcription factor [Coriobacteriales bacterium]|jgi:DNA-binding response OmpR family regulator|nr:response regulator transcription factor [Coriobacteriales bacterium]
MNILLIEDQQRLAQALSAILEETGYHVDTVGDGRSGLEYGLSAEKTGTPYDAIVLDVMLPVMDGFEVARRLRREGSSSPIIMLTARDTLRDKVMGLDAGADDYLTKPFQPAELLARLRALTRRSGPVHVEVITLGNTSLDLQSTELRKTQELESTEGSVDGSVEENIEDLGIHLSQREFELCQLLMTHPGQTLTKARLLSRVWGLGTDTDENSVEAYISFLRKKLFYLKSDLSIVTVRGIGYRLEAPELHGTDGADGVDGADGIDAPGEHHAH